MMEQYRNGLDEGKPQARAALGLIGNKLHGGLERVLERRLGRAGENRRVDMARLRALGKAITTYPTDWALHPAGARHHAGAREDGERRSARSIGAAPRTWPMPAWFRKAIRCASPDRTAAAARSSIATRYCTIRVTGRALRPAAASCDQPADVHGDRFGAVRRSGDGLRIRFLDHRAALPDHLGRPVRRFLQRRPGHHRSVHQFRRGQVGPPVAASPCSCRMATKARGPSIPRRAWSASCSCAPSTTCRCACRRLRRRCFTCCAGRCCAALRKPLIVMTPKSLLRHPLSVSRLEELAGGGFHTVIDEIDDIKPVGGDARRALQRQGVFRSVEVAARSRRSTRCAIVRIEQLYPFPSEEYEAILRKYPNAREIVWCQEEPQNQGGWYQIRHRLQSKLDDQHELLYAGPRRRGGAGHRHRRSARAAAEKSGRRGAARRRRRKRLATNHARPGRCKLGQAIMTTEVRVPQLPESVADATLGLVAQEAGRYRRAR